MKIKNKEYCQAICAILHEISNGHFFDREHTFTQNANAAKDRFLIISTSAKQICLEMNCTKVQVSSAGSTVMPVYIYISKLT